MLRADLATRAAPAPEELETAHRRAQVAQGMLVAYGVTVLRMPVFYAFRPYATTNTPLILEAVVFLLTAVAFASWQVAAYRLVSAFSGAPADHAPSWAALGYVIPIGNLWFPYQVMREIDEASDPDALNPGLGARRSVPPLRTWWALWVTMGISSRVYEKVPEPPPYQEALAYEVAGVVLVVGWFALIAAALLVICRLDKAQQEVGRLIGEAQASVRREPRLAPAR